MSPVDPGLPVAPATGKGVRAPLDGKSIRDRIESHGLHIKRLESQRNPRPLRLAQLQDTGMMTQAPAGHAGTYDINTGEFIPSPNLAILMFQMRGPVATGLSPPHWSRYATKIVGIAACLGTGGSGSVNFEVLIDSVVSFSVTGVTPGPVHAPVTPVKELDAYARLQIDVTSAGSGNMDLLIQVELGSNIAGTPGPNPFGG